MSDILFVKPFGVYSVGDVAHFPDGISTDIISKGAAVPYTAPAKAADKVLPPRRGHKAISTK